MGGCAGPEAAKQQQQQHLRSMAGRIFVDLSWASLKARPRIGDIKRPLIHPDPIPPSLGSSGQPSSGSSSASLGEMDGAGARMLAFRVTQVLTGHGCFGEYLKRIGAEATAGCHHCEAQTPRSIRLQNAKHLKSSVTHLPRPSEIIYPQPRLSERYLLEQAKEKRSTHFAKK